MIVQGDEYLLPLDLKQGETTIIPAMISGLLVQIEDTEYKYPTDITYSDNKWYVQLTQAQTLSMKRAAQVQAQVKMITGDILNTVPVFVSIQNALIKKVWS